MTDTNRITVATGNEYTIGAARVESGTAAAYRLVRYRTPEGFVHLKLQGAYQWTQGPDAGHEWRDIETVDLDKELHK
jgi:hypothetical protein